MSKLKIASLANLAGPATGHVARLGAANARMLADTIECTYTRQFEQAASRSQMLRETAAKIQAAAEKAAKGGTRAGGREHLKGHFIERLDVSTYNAKNRFTGKNSSRGRTRTTARMTLAASSTASSPRSSTATCPVAISLRTALSTQPRARRTPSWGIGAMGAGGMAATAALGTSAGTAAAASAGAAGTAALGAASAAWVPQVPRSPARWAGSPSRQLPRWWLALLRRRAPASSSARVLSARAIASGRTSTSARRAPTTSPRSRSRPPNSTRTAPRPPALSSSRSNRSLERADAFTVSELDDIDALVGKLGPRTW